MRGLTLLFLTITTIGLTACAASSEEDDEGTSGEAVTSAPDPEPPGRAIFANDAGFKVTRSDDLYTQRYKIVSGEIYCESVTHVAGSIDRALALLRGRWDWYGGAVDDFDDTHPSGHITYTLWPTGKLINLPGNTFDFGVHVSEDMSPPIKLHDGGYRILIELGIFGSGQAYIEMHPEPGGFRLIGRFAGVKSNYLGTEFFAKAHLGAEAGKPPFPLAQGGGFEGLRKALRP